MLAIHDLAIAIQPVIPEKAGALLDDLGVPADRRTYDHISGEGWFNQLVAEGFTVPKPNPAFPRLEIPESEDA